MFLRKALMIRELLYLTRSAPAQLVSIAIAVPIISNGQVRILIVHHGYLAAVLLVANGTRMMAVTHTNTTLL